MTPQPLIPPALESHLTEGELDEVLIGIGSARSRRHLAACAACRRQAEAFTATVATFNLASASWSQARSNTISRDLSALRQPAPPVYRRPAALWVAGAALLLALSTGIGVRVHDSALEDAHMAAVAAELADDRSNQIAADNAMMRDIDSALHAPVASPAQFYGNAPAEVRE